MNLHEEKPMGCGIQTWSVCLHMTRFYTYQHREIEKKKKKKSEKRFEEKYLRKYVFVEIKKNV